MISGASPLIRLFGSAAGARRRLAAGWIIAALLPALGPPADAAGGGAPPAAAGLRFSRHTLPNGLTLLMAEEHSHPLVSVVAWYRVGARNERPGITGIAHYLEHMAFRATRNIAAEDVTGAIERLGGHWHGYTRLDNTVYYETVRREALDWLLFLEAERMQRCLLLPAEVEIERGGILSELKGYENDPWSLLFDDVAATAFSQHPYGYNISGWVSDLEAITHADVLDFYRRHYVPANVILTLVGDFDARRALAAVRRHFGPLPTRPALEPLRTVEPPQRGERRVTLRMPGAAAHVLVAHHAPAFAEPDFFPLLVLDGVLSGGRGVSTLDGEFEIGPLGAERRTRRLYRDLVSSGLATRVSAGLLPTLHPYLYTVTAEAAPGADPGALEGGIVRALEQMGTAPVPDEELAAVRRRLSVLSRLQQDTYQDAAHLRTLLEAYGAGDLWGRIEERIAAVGPADVQAAARRIFHPDNRTAGRFEPRSETAAAGAKAPGVSPAAAPAPPQASPRLEAPQAGPRLAAPKIALARIDPPPPAQRRRLPSGLEIAASENGWVTTAALAAEIDAGPAFDSGRGGIAALTARLLASGSADSPAAETTAAIDRLGLRWRVRVGGGDIDFPDPRLIRVELELAAEDLEEAAALLAGALRAPAFPADAFRAARDAQGSEAAALEDDAGGLAWVRLLGSLYAGTPWERIGSGLGAPDGVAALSRADARDFHARFYRPERARVAFSGGLPAARALEVLERAFAAWRPAPPEGPAGDAPEGAGGRGAERLAVPRPEPPAPPVPARLAHKTRVDMAYGFFAGSGADAAGRDALEALAHIVHHNYGGRLGDRIIMQGGLAYSIDSALAPDLPGSPWLLTTGSPPDRAERLRRIWDETLDEVARRGVTARELEGARTWLQGRILHERESNLASARAALDRMRPGGRPPADPAALTLQSVNRAAREVLGGRRAVWSLAGPVP